MKAIAIGLMLVLAALPTAVAAQVFGQYTTAAISSEGEGGVFANAGEDRFQTGIVARFLLTRQMDFGVQLGLDRECGVSSFGGSLDLKVYILGEQSEIPIDLAVGGSYGHLRSSDYRRHVFAFGLLASGVVQSSTSVAIEPYGFGGLVTEYFERNCPCTGPGDCFWPGDPGEAKARETKARLRGGVKVTFTDEYQLLVEASVDRKFMVGAAFNIIF
jgi:hypothetical protein